jgi:hypothetical protein|tara:strand:- start:225 stop:863 length:639 start_codon:yes stop_codon:yes gene_type:complete
MDESMLLALTALALGFLHGLGADHLMAITVLSAGESGVGGSGRMSFGVAARFAFGHALLLCGGAVFVLMLGWQIPLAFEQVSEVFAGGLLVLLGSVGLWAMQTGRLYGHDHSAERRHSRLPTVLGAVFAVSGLRSLTLLAPFENVSTVNSSLLILVLLILVFAVGIMLSMCLFGAVLARVWPSRNMTRIGKPAFFVTAVASILLGLYWIVPI